MRILDTEQEETIKGNYRSFIGTVIRRRRERVNLSQEELSEALHISRNTLGQYENGGGDISAAMLPLISTYCKFPMSEYNDASIEQMVSAFSCVVEVTRRKYQRIMEKERKRSRRRLKAYVYEEDGTEYTQYVDSRKKERTYREQLAHGDVVMDVHPYTDDEFGEYLLCNKSEDLQMLIAAGTMLDYIATLENKESVKSCICSFTIERVIVEPVIAAETESTKRAYMYYRRILKQKEMEHYTDGN